VQEGRPSARRDGEYGTVGVLGVTDPDGGLPNSQPPELSASRTLSLPNSQPPELDRRAADAAPDSAVVQFGNWRLSRDPGNT
jgi:hypothetical protein